MADDTIPRRDFLKGAVGAVGTAAAITTVGAEQAQAQPAASPAPASPSPDDEPLLTLTATEHAFVAAAVDTLIPADELSPSGSACGVAVFIDRQLAGAYGMGARLYRQGPFPKAKPELGYQLSLNPREFFRAGIEAANAWSRKTYGKDFDRLSEQDREAALKAMDEGKADVLRLQQPWLFQCAVADHHGGLLLRPDLWRQPRHGVVEDDRLPRPARDLPRRDQDLFRQEIRQAAALDRGLHLRSAP